MTSCQQDTGIYPPENSADSRITATCSNCTYDFIFKPLPSLLHSHSTLQNIIPSDTEAIQLFISDAEGEATRCGDEISRLKEIIEKVKIHQANLNHEICIHKSFITPNHPQVEMISAKGKEDISGSRITATCSSCIYEFILKSMPSVIDSHSTRQNIILCDTQVIQSFIVDAEEEVTRCSDEVSHLRAVIDEVENRQSQFNHEISIHQSFMAPIRRLPPELLTLIFSLFCTVDFWDCRPFELKCIRMSGSLFREPFIIATVCSHWRSIALSTSSLWSTIMLGGYDIDLSREDYLGENPDSEPDLDDTFPEDILEVALDRSAQHPLKLWIECFRDSEYWPSIFTTKLRQVCSRIEQIYVAGAADPFQIPNSPNLTFDELSAVRVCPHADIQSMDRLPWLSMAPSVQTLVLQNLEEAETEFWTFEGSGPAAYTYESRMTQRFEGEGFIVC
ncbi:hypothetical protein C8J56DRAFT_1165277 [Mycena floridula]|nr:hypothetical protein C8J56DRAFT_1165277 [Mycena floridula]